MKSNYKPIGKYIRLVDERNKGLRVQQLLGLSISKQFIPSVANIIGTDMENYKIIRKNQFACSTMQVRRDKKMPVALLKDLDEAIISQAYPIFEVKDPKELLPEYLMMWFTRSEFDREACFHAVGGVRGSLEWEDFENLHMPIPHPDKQREIVKEYNAIQNRIALNQQLIQKLEETAQAIYREWFVEFNFPDENGNPYKSNGGKMVWCEELGKEIPKGWEVGILKDVLECNPDTLSINDDFSSILYLDTSNITNNRINELQELNLDTDEIPSRARRKVKDNDIIYSTVRPVLKHYGIIKNLPENLIVSTGFAVFRMKKSNLSSELIYSFLTDETTITFLQAKAEMSVSTYPSVTSDDILNLDFVIPSEEVLNLAKDIFKSKDDYINLKNKENQKLSELKSLVLSNLSTIEN
jgi:type I restriction enzyme S subunit